MTWQTVVATPSALGESPFWHPQEQMLYWVDIAGMQIHRLNAFRGMVESWAMPSEPGCVAPARSGGLVIALRDRIVRARAWGGALELLSRFNHDPTTTRFNDGKCDPLGRFWAGTMFEPRTARKADLFSLDARGTMRSGDKPIVQLKAHNATIANGLAWSPDAKTVYWADTPRHTIYAWDYDARSNGMTHHRVFKQFAPKPAGWLPFQPDNGGYLGRPDGASVDAQGNYWVAMYEGQRVLQLSPQGEILQNIPSPALCNTMPCFGGDDLQTLYLTSARHGRSAEDLVRQPALGQVFSLRVAVPGLATNLFED
ncbi:MAG: SMP-30/gluconolactonase/LRE family protein [Burkholderiaceae bacterium]